VASLPWRSAVTADLRSVPTVAWNAAGIPSVASAMTTTLRIHALGSLSKTNAAMKDEYLLVGRELVASYFRFEGIKMLD
jgi:hypothetical protein